MAFARAFALVDVAPAARAGVAPAGPEPAVANDDELVAGIALEYARRSLEFVASTAAIRQHGLRGEPPPVDTLLRFHERIYSRTMRALVGYRLAAAGPAHRGFDAGSCAGRTLACIDRSRAALAHFPDSDERRFLASQLDAIGRALEARFPDAGAVDRERKKICAA